RTRIRSSFFSSRRRHTRFSRDWSSDVCSSDLLHRYAVQYADDVSVDASNRLRLENAKISPELLQGMRFRKAAGAGGTILFGTARSEERRVGKEGSWWGWAGASRKRGAWALASA